MNVRRLTLALALSVGIAGTNSLQVNGQQCDGNCDGRTCKSCCDDNGILDRMGNAAARLESHMRSQFRQMAHLSPQACDQVEKGCDTLPGKKCMQCQSLHTQQHQQENRTTPGPTGQFSPHPISPDSSGSGSSRIQPNPGSEMQHGPPVPAPLPDDPSNDAKNDPFKDDTAMYWRSSPSGARSVGYMRHISTESQDQGRTQHYYAEAFSPQASNANIRSISSPRTADRLVADQNLSTRQSSRQTSNAPGSSRQFLSSSSKDVAREFIASPHSIADVVPASAVAPIAASATARISDYGNTTAPQAVRNPNRAAWYNSTVPENPLRYRR